jgi:hypothetical protein
MLLPSDWMQLFLFPRHQKAHCALGQGTLDTGIECLITNLKRCMKLWILCKPALHCPNSNTKRFGNIGLRSTTPGEELSLRRGCL